MLIWYDLRHILLTVNKKTTYNMNMLFLLFACKPETKLPEDMTCNGLDELCSKQVDQVLFPATHNSMSSAEDEWLFPNQNFNIKSQLEDGIRGLNLDTYLWEEEAYLCHSYCDLGKMTLVEGFSMIEEFLTENPRNVIIITFQSALSAENTMAAFEDSKLAQRLYHYELGEEWPTLESLIEQEKQVIAFSSGEGGTIDGYLEQWVHWVDNPYSARAIEDFSCEIDRGDTETATLFNVNHFITAPLASEEDSQTANQYDVLKDHLYDCWEQTDRFPNQLLVDFYDQGPVLEIAREINLEL